MTTSKKQNDSARDHVILRVPFRNPNYLHTFLVNQPGDGCSMRQSLTTRVLEGVVGCGEGKKF